jgi:hypothetical protein
MLVAGRPIRNERRRRDRRHARGARVRARRAPRGVYRRLWPTLAFAFGPPLWVSATQDDRLPFGLALVLFAYLAALGKRGAWAGLLLALATGCRGTFAWFMPPMLMLLVARGAAPGAVARYLISFWS